jgi:uncharacterized protein YwqG
MSDERVTAHLRAAGLERLAERILPLARPAVRLVTTKARDEKLPVGTSKVGGFPDLRRDGDWPTWSEQRLGFLAQVNVADLRAFGFCDVLPEQGLLQFFYDRDQQTWGFDPKDRGSWCVRFESSVDGLARSVGDKLYPTCRVDLHETVAMPTWDSFDFEQLGLSSDDREAYFRALDDVESAEPDATPLHQILGNPSPIQGDMQLECQLVSNGIYCGGSAGYADPRAQQLAPGAADWRLLFQLDSDGAADMMWGDAGRLYFWITREALKQRRFDETWMILQCG